MDEHVIEKPEVDIRQVGGENRLDAGVCRLAPTGIGFRAALFDKRVELRVDIETAVSPVWREFVGVEGVFEDVGILVTADPTQRIYLVSAGGDIGKKRRELEGTDV